MQFIKQMKKREYIEIGLKFLASVLAAFIAIILMEGMIYGIKLNAFVSSTNNQTRTISNPDTVNDVYCIKTSDNNYYVLTHTMDKLNGEFWSCDGKLYNKDHCDELKATSTHVYFNAPNAFEFSIEPYHYAIMIVLEGIVIGYFVYRFIKLGKNYKQVQNQFNLTGTIEISNQ